MKIKSLVFSLLMLAFVTSKSQEIKLSDSLLNYTFKTPQEKSISLASFKGSIVLVEFWASWDIPSRKNHVELLKIYQEYLDKKFKSAKRFNIVSISLDVNPKHHKLAVSKDGMIWKNIVCDFKGWESPWVDIFKIKMLPQNFLLDGNGKVIAQDLWYEELEKQLRALQ
jgi:hypothetical protein